MLIKNVLGSIESNGNCLRFYVGNRDVLHGLPDFFFCDINFEEYLNAVCSFQGTNIRGRNPRQKIEMEV